MRLFWTMCNVFRTACNANEVGNYFLMWNEAENAAAKLKNENFSGKSLLKVQISL